MIRVEGFRRWWRIFTGAAPSSSPGASTTWCLASSGSRWVARKALSAAAGGLSCELEAGHPGPHRAHDARGGLVIW